MTNTHENKTSSKYAWTMLLLAGVFEVGYALCVAGSQAFTILGWSITALIFFLLTLYALSVALKTINVGIGYAVWAGIGAVGSTIFGGLIFDEDLSLNKIFWLTLIIVGVIWLKLASNDEGQVSKPAQV